MCPGEGLGPKSRGSYLLGETSACVPNVTATTKKKNCRGHSLRTGSICLGMKITLDAKKRNILTNVIMAFLRKHKFRKKINSS
jgi:hypothetical protein